MQAREIKANNLSISCQDILFNTTTIICLALIARRTLTVCTKCYVHRSSSCWDITLWTEVDWQADRPDIAIPRARAKKCNRYMTINVWVTLNNPQTVLCAVFFVSLYWKNSPFKSVDGEVCGLSRITVSGNTFCSVCLSVSGKREFFKCNFSALWTLQAKFHSPLLHWG